MDLRPMKRDHQMPWPMFVLLSYLLSPSGASNAEGNALYAVKQSLNDPKGVLKTWNSDLVDPCSSWTLVTCDEQKHVIEVSLAGQGFTGVLSTQIAYLPKLRTLTLSNNKLSGGIPTAIFAISSLLSLDLSFNNLTGMIRNTAFKIPVYNFVGNQLTCMSSSEVSCQLSRSMGSALQNQVSSSRRSNIAALVGGILSAAIVLMAAIVISSIWWDNYHRQKQDVFVDVADEGDLELSFGQLKRFSWRELQVATDNFNEKNLLGQGGFSKVFKGVLGDGTQIAVKRLKDNHLRGGEAAFLREVEMIGVAVHRNLLNLIGFCAIPSERILVYPFMVNRSVAYQLRERKTGDAKLNWSKRKQIALGAARGLAYLHDHCNPRIIHRDVKAANILLDEDLQAVVGDFGLAKLVDTKDTHVTTVVRGTMGHIAPEYLSTGKSSEKTDVFGYGIMLLELVTGQRAIDFSRLQEDGVLLLDHVKKLQREKRLVSIVDPSLQHYNAQEVEELIQVALLCTQPTPEDRPKMEEVTRMLAGEGLAERWEEWQQVEGLRRQEYELMPHRLAEWVEDSTVNQEAIELSAGR